MTKMLLLKSVDDKLADIGFRKVEDDYYHVRYERKNEKHNFTQVLTILHKISGRHIILSYDRDLFDVKDIGNTCIGLTYYETKLILKKMKKKGWVSK